MPVAESSTVSDVRPIQVQLAPCTGVPDIAAVSAAACAGCAGCAACAGFSVGGASAGTCTCLGGLGRVSSIAGGVISVGGAPDCSPIRALVSLAVLRLVRGCG